MSAPPPIYGSIVVAQFAAQAMLRLRPESAASAVVVMEGVRPHESAYALNAKALALGLCAGMTRVEVESFDRITILPRSQTEERAAQRILLEAMDLFSPRVEVLQADPHWECLLDLAGTERLLGTPEELGGRVIAHLGQLGFAAHIAICTNGDAGLSLARFAAHRPTGSPSLRIVCDGSPQAALAPLPLHVLSLDGESQSRFDLWGIASLGELAALPEIELIARMGQAGKRLRLRARGELPHLLQPATEELCLKETMEFDDPVESLEPLLFCVNIMLEQLILRAQGRSHALAHVTVSLLLQGSGDRVLNKSDSSGRPIDAGPLSFERSVRPAIPTQNRPLLLKMLQLDLEAHPAPGAVMRLDLSAEAGEIGITQMGFFAPQMPEPTRFEETYARLLAIVGEGNIGRVRLLDTHAPEAFSLERFTLPRPVVKAPSPRPRHSRPATSMRRMRPPIEIRVSMQQQRICHFLFEARRYVVLRCYGPWRSSGDWWRPEVWSSDSWDLAARVADDAQGELLLCVVGHDLLRNRWQMEALYD